MMNLTPKHKTLKKFRGNEDGNVFILTGLLAPLLVLSIGVAIDTAEIYRNKVTFQQALDAGTLAASKVIAKTNNKPEALAAGKRVFAANVKNVDPVFSDFTFQSPDSGCNGGPLVGTAKLRHPLYFGSFYEAFYTANLSFINENGEVTHNGSTEVSCSQPSLEVALVLDVSKSMGHESSSGDERKIDSLERAAQNFISDLHTSFESLPDPDSLKFSVVPFAGFVNVGNRYKDKDWMDKEGRASYHHEDLNWHTNFGHSRRDGVWRDNETNEILTRFTLFDALGEPWAGCLNHRPYPLNTTDEPADPSRPDTLFVPAFAPDMPDYLTGQLTDRGGSISREKKFWNNYLNDYHNAPSWLPVRSSNHTGRDNQWKRYHWPFKYFNHSEGGDSHPEHENSHTQPVQTSTFSPVYTGNGYEELSGPNNYCRSDPLTSLTNDQDTALDAVTDMTLGWGTEIHQGVLWGWRALSEGEPLDGGRPYDTPDNSKIMVVMSDGANAQTRAYVGSRSAWPVSLYFAHGHARNGRVWEGSEDIVGSNPNFARMVNPAMNNLQLQTCANARAKGITIYTIAFDIKQTGARNTMRQCASTGPDGEPLFYTADDGDELVAAFNDIASSVTQLRVSK